MSARFPPPTPQHRSMTACFAPPTYPTASFDDCMLCSHHLPHSIVRWLHALFLLPTPQYSLTTACFAPTTKPGHPGHPIFRSRIRTQRASLCYYCLFLAASQVTPNPLHGDMNSFVTVSLPSEKHREYNFITPESIQPHLLLSQPSYPMVIPDSVDWKLVGQPMQSSTTKDYIRAENKA